LTDLLGIDGKIPGLEGIRHKKEDKTPDPSLWNYLEAASSELQPEEDN
jgi:hypothetical protein